MVGRDHRYTYRVGTPVLWELGSRGSFVCVSCDGHAGGLSASRAHGGGSFPAHGSYWSCGSGLSWDLAGNVRSLCSLGTHRCRDRYAYFAYPSGRESRSHRWASGGCICNDDRLSLLWFFAFVRASHSHVCHHGGVGRNHGSALAWCRSDRSSSSDHVDWGCGGFLCRYQVG